MAAIFRYELPKAAGGQRIGLYGGSFDPAHDAHVHVTKEALKRFNLDRIWWLFSPGNPLKEDGPAPIETRLAFAKSLFQHRGVEMTDVEAVLGTKYTHDTLDVLQSKFPNVKFTWLMGADNLIQFDQWQNWQGIMNSMPVGVWARPGLRVGARTSKAAQVFRRNRLPQRNSRAVSGSKSPAWCFTNIPMRSESSSEIRASGQWGHGHF